MLSIPKMISSAEEALGWPYVSPGTNDVRGIDCSGLFVKMYRDQGASIYHGSNTIFHEHCKETGKLTKVSHLQVGMAVFKLKPWTEKDKGNKWYGKEPGNLSHIGIVTSVSPLKIIHASSAAGCVTTDTKIGKWAYWGKLKLVDYGGDHMIEVETAETIQTAVVFAVTGTSVKMRAKPSLNCAQYHDIPIGTEVEVLERHEDWCKIRARGREGYMMTQFLQMEESLDGADQGEKVLVSKKDLEDVYARLEAAQGQLFVDKGNIAKAYDIIGDMLGLRG